MKDIIDTSDKFADTLNALAELAEFDHIALVYDDEGFVIGAVVGTKEVTSLAADALDEFFDIDLLEKEDENKVPDTLQ